MSRHTNPEAERLFAELLQAGMFEIDSEGRIWRLKDLRYRTRPIRRRAERQTDLGYLQVAFMFEGKRYYPLAHRLVYLHLKGRIPDGDEVNHDNGMKDCNRPSNLLLGSSSENSTHASRNGLRDQYGQKNPHAKLTDNQVARIRLAYSKGGYTMKELADKFGIQFQHVSRLVRGERRPKQAGPVMDIDHRHCASVRDETTGRFLPRNDTANPHSMEAQ